MTFSLSDSLLDKIRDALDNQEKKFLVDAKHGDLVEKESLEADEENYYELPVWDSSNGFQLREKFVKNLFSPAAKSELQEVLHSGRGVFKNFRNILKKFPDVEKRWHVFRNTEMNIYINNWYNSLREIWGLEKLDYIPESDENLVHDDFLFRKYNSDLDSQIVVNNIHASFFGENTNLPDELNSAVFEMWYNQFLNANSTSQTGFICRSVSDDFAGCVLASPVSKKQGQVFIITSLFVSESFRGLGIGTELISMCLSELKAAGKTWALMPDIIIPDILIPLLTRNGFEKIGTGYAVKL